MQHYLSTAEDYQPEWMPDFEEELFKSVAELGAARSEYERWVALGNIGLWNVDAGLTKNAERIAEELLRLGEKYKNDWNYGNSIHKAHLILGRIALREGNVDAAVEHLIAAGETLGSPQLDSFGPKMILAKELLEVDIREPVGEYIKLCRTFWLLDGGQLSAWDEIISRGDVPNFGANLVY